MPLAVVDQVVGVDDALVAAEDDARRWNEREVPAQPPVFRIERTGHVHRGRRDEDFVAFRQLSNDGLAIGQYVEILEERRIEHCLRGGTMPRRNALLEVTTLDIGQAQVRAV